MAGACIPPCAPTIEARIEGEGRVIGVEDAENLVIDRTPQHRARLPTMGVKLRDAEGAEGAEGAPILAFQISPRPELTPHYVQHDSAVEQLHVKRDGLATRAH